MNPFSVISAKSKCGIFAATGVKNSKTTTIAERICAAISRAIANPENNEKVLQSEWWQECVSQIPQQVPVSNISIKANVSEKKFSLELAKLCTSASFRENSNGDITGIQSLIANLPPLESLQSLDLSCFSISSSKSGQLQISLAILSIDGMDSSLSDTGTRSVSGSLQETIVPYDNPKIARGIDEVFNDVEALKDEPYYVCVRA